MIKFRDRNGVVREVEFTGSEEMVLSMVGANTSEDAVVVWRRIFAKLFHAGWDAALSEETRQPSRPREEDVQKVLDYVRNNPRCTCRDVARDVFGGTGATRTSERSRAHVVLCYLATAKHVRREGGTGTRWEPYRWSATTPLHPNDRAQLEATKDAIRRRVEQ